MSQNVVERATEFDVEDGVDERIEETIDVAKPDEEREQERVDMTSGTVLEQVVADTDGVDDVDCEERHPTKHKHTCQQYTAPSSESRCTSSTSTTQLLLHRTHNMHPFYCFCTSGTVAYIDYIHCISKDHKPLA